jgi:hypothetical protein
VFKNGHFIGHFVAKIVSDTQVDGRAGQSVQVTYSGNNIQYGYGGQIAAPSMPDREVQLYLNARKNVEEQLYTATTSRGSQLVKSWQESAYTWIGNLSRPL